MSKTAKKASRFADRNGCAAWEYKWTVLLILGNVPTAGSKAKQMEEMFDKWAPTEVKNIPDILSNLIAAIAKYGSTCRPERTTGQFFLRIAQAIFDSHKVNGDVGYLIKEASAAELFNAIPESSQKDLPRPRTGAREDEVRWLSLTHRPMPNVIDGIENGRINQLLHYIGSDGPRAWDEIRGDKSYKQSEECMESLQEFLRSELWINFVLGQKVLNILMLGGGAPEKENTIIQSALRLKPRMPVTYRLFDASAPMIHHTHRHVQEHFRRLNLQDQVAVYGVYVDFTTLSDLPRSPGLRESNERSIWFCPGGTIGNLYEDAVFKSVAHQSQPGDVFVVGAEHLDAADLQATEKSIQAKYSGSGIAAFVVAPIRSASTRVEIPNSDRKLNAALKTELLSAALSKRYSSVPGARTIEISIPNGIKRLVLHTSTRYPTGGIEALAAKNDFVVRQTFASASNPRYKTFFFEYEPV